MSTNMFASAQDKTVQIWDLHSDAACKLLLSGHSDLVLCLDYFSMDDKLYLISGSQDKTAKVWNCETGSCVETLEGHMDAVTTACCHPHLLMLITGSRDGSVCLWDATTFRHQCTLNFGLGGVYAIASLKGSARIAIGLEKGLAQLVDTDLVDEKDGCAERTVALMGSRKDMGRIMDREGIVDWEIIYKIKSAITIDVHPTDRWMVITQANKFVRIWDYDTQKEEVFATKGKQVTSAKFIARNRWIVVGCSSGSIYVYSYHPVNKNQVKKIAVLRGHSKSVNSLDVHPKQPFLLSACQDGKILFWSYDENGFELENTFDAKSPVKHVAFTSMGITSAQDKTVKLWDRRSGASKLTFSGHSDLVLSFNYWRCLQLDKRYLVTGSQDKTVKIWDFETGSCVQTLEGHTDVVKVAWTGFHRIITGSQDGSVRLWKWDSSSTTFRLERVRSFDLGSLNSIDALDNENKSQRIAVGFEKGLLVADINT